MKRLIPYLLLLSLLAPLGWAAGAAHGAPVSDFPRDVGSYGEAADTGLLEMLQAERKFTIIRADQFGGFRDLETLLTRYPELPVAIAQAYWTHQRYFTPLLQAYKNLHIMTSHYQAHYGLETLVMMCRFIYACSSGVK